MLFLEGNLCLWKTSGAKAALHSTTEVEIVAGSEAARALEGCINMLGEIAIKLSLDVEFEKEIFGDNVFSWLLPFHTKRASEKIDRTAGLTEGHIALKGEYCRPIVP